MDLIVDPVGRSKDGPKMIVDPPWTPLDGPTTVQRRSKDGPRPQVLSWTLFRPSSLAIISQKKISSPQQG